jgi:glycosyltransferase involved in cell wall biosynthesis
MKSALELRRTPEQYTSEPFAAKRLKVAIVCDFSEEGWPSMDLVGNVLVAHLSRDHGDQVEVEQFRPAMRMRVSGLPGLERNGAARNIDRLINRFRDYPRRLQVHASDFDLFHIVDHSYSQLASTLPEGRVIVTCHDLDTFRCILEPQRDPRPRWYRVMSARVLYGFRKAVHVICNSFTTRDEILRHGLFPAKRLSVAYLGVNPLLLAASSESTQGRMTRPYLLHVGSTIPRKRIDVLLRVFAAVARDFPELRLVKVGGSLTSMQGRLAAELGIQQRIDHIPHLLEPELAGVYRNAVCLLQTSDAEGFGLPVIEALACGCTVVASDIPSLREAGGCVATYCAVGDVSAWSKTICAMLIEQRRRPDIWELRQNDGKRHAAQFTFEKTAHQTLEIYRSVASRSLQ